MSQAPPENQQSRRLLDNALLVGACVVAILIAVNTGLRLTTGGSKIAVLVPLALPATLLLVGFALTRFEWLVLLLLAARSSLDSTKLSAAPASVVRQGGSAAPGHGVDPAAVVAVGFILASLIWLVWNRTAAERAVKAPRLERALCLMFFIWSLSIIGSQRPLTSFLEAVRILAVVLMLVVLDRLLVDPKKIKPVLVAVFASTVVPLLVAAYQAISTHGRFEAGGFSRIRSTFVHPNPFALYLTFMIAMGVALLPHVAGRVRIALGTVLVGCGIALVLTYTRTAWICTVLALIMVGILQSKRLLGLLLVGGLVAVIAVPSIGARFSDLSDSSHASGTAGNSLIWRVDYWTQMLPLANRNPATGIGLKMAQYNTEEQKAPHNDFLRAYVETGILGFLAYLWLLFCMVDTAWSAVVRAGPGFDKGVAVGFAACVTAYLTMSLVSNVVSQVVLLWYFFAFAACAIAVSRRHEPDHPDALLRLATVE